MVRFASEKLTPVPDLVRPNHCPNTTSLSDRAALKSLGHGT